MLYNVVEKAKNGDNDAMMQLIRKFGSLLHKYANKLEYEDAYQDYVLYFIELVKSGSLEKLKDKNDGLSFHISISAYKTTIKRKSKQ